MAGRMKKTMTVQTATVVGATLIKLLQDEDFRRRMGEVSASARSWASRRKSQMAISSSSTAGPTGIRSKFGQGALEKRVAGLRTMASNLGTSNPELTTQITSTADDLQRALAVTANMPPSTRWRAQRSIDKRLDEIEKALIDAMLPGPAPR